MIIMLSVFFSLYSFEFFLTYKSSKSNNDIFDKEIMDKYEKDTGKKFDKRKKIEIFQDFETKNKNNVVAVKPYQHLDSKNIFPLSGISNSKTIHCNENGYYSVYYSDRYGFNNPDVEWENNYYEYVAIGDSFVHGACVNRPNDISSILRILSNKPVLNLGYDGNGPLLEYAALREYLPKNVNKILWFYYEGNDLFFLDYEFTNVILKKYLANDTFSQNLKFKQKIINKKLINVMNESFEIKNNQDQGVFLKTLYDFSFKIDKVRTLLQRLLPNKYQSHSTPNVQPMFVEIIKKTLDLSNHNKSELVFVYLPEYKRYKNNYSDKNYLKIKSEIKKMGIKFIDIHEEFFKKEENPLSFFPFEKHGHYTVDGYKKISEIVFKLTTD